MYIIRQHVRYGCHVNGFTCTTPTKTMFPIGPVPNGVT